MQLPQAEWPRLRRALAKDDALPWDVLQAGRVGGAAERVYCSGTAPPAALSPCFSLLLPSPSLPACGFVPSRPPAHCRCALLPGRGRSPPPQPGLPLQLCATNHHLPRPPRARQTWLFHPASPQALALLDSLAGAGGRFWERYAHALLPGPTALALPCCLPDPPLLEELQHGAIVAGARAQKERLRGLFPGLSAAMCEGEQRWWQRARLLACCLLAWA